MSREVSHLSEFEIVWYETAIGSDRGNYIWHSKDTLLMEKSISYRELEDDGNDDDSD